MKCFYILKDRSKKKKGDSKSPELRNQSRPISSNQSTTSTSLPSTRSITELYNEKEPNMRVFSFEELKEATHNFSISLKIGEGGFGSVYKGSIRPATGQSDSVFVAIKKLNRHGLQGHKQWVAEVQFLGVVSHPNLVKLIGYCCVDDERGIQRLLVYEFMPNKSLEDHLFNRALSTLPWRKRLEIMVGAAEGLAYLHSGMEVQVIYRDFKASNVLLDESFKPKLSDFGLAREGPTGDQTHVSTGVVGTFGYACPEYVETGHLTIHSDVWSFGVVLYEILTGRRTLERNLPTKEQKLLDWVKQFPADSKKFSMIIDPRLRNEYSISAAKRIAKLADSCLIKNPKERPTMTQVVFSLREAMQETQGTTTSHTKTANSSKANGKRR